MRRLEGPSAKQRKGYSAQPHNTQCEASASYIIEQTGDGSAEKLERQEEDAHSPVCYS